MIKKSTNKITIFLFLGIALVISAPFIFTRSGYIDFRATGPIGDTIGGITAPITSLIGSILLYFALKTQIDANKLIQDQFEDQKKTEIERKKLLYISEKTNLLRNDINEFSFTYIETKSDGMGGGKKQKFNFIGSDAINKFLDNNHFIGKTIHEDPFIIYPKLTELLHILKMMNSLIDSINSENISSNDKEFYKSLIAHLFTSKLKSGFDRNVKWSTRNEPICLNCNFKHKGIPEELFDLADTINNKIK